MDKKLNNFFLEKKNAFKIAAIVNNDKSNFAPYLFRSLCEIVGDCFAASKFLEKYLGPNQSPPISSERILLCK